MRLTYMVPQSSAEFKSSLIQALTEAPAETRPLLRLSATLVKDELSLQRDSSVVTKLFTFEITGLHPTPEEYHVTVWDTEADKWSLIQVTDDAIIFDVVS